MYIDVYEIYPIKYSHIFYLKKNSILIFRYLVLLLCWFVIDYKLSLYHIYLSLL